MKGGPTSVLIHAAEPVALVALKAIGPWWKAYPLQCIEKSLTSVTIAKV